MATVAIIAVAAAAAISAYSAVQQGQAAKKAADFNAAVAERNAKLSQDAAAAQADTQDRQARQRLGAIRAAYGGSGVSSEGSPLDVLENSASLAELDKQNILYSGNLRAMGFTDTAALDRFSGSNAQSASYLSAASTLIGGAGKAIYMGSGGTTSGAGAGSGGVVTGESLPLSSSAGVPFGLQ